MALATGQKWEDAEGLGASADVVAALEERPGFKDIRVSAAFRETEHTAT